MPRRRRPRRPTAAATAVRPPRFGIDPLEARRLLAVTVEFDYSFDTAGFFDDADRRAALEAAAASVTNGMTDSLDAIEPGGADAWTVTFPNPGSGDEEDVDDLEVPADTVIIYAGARALDGDTLGRGGPAGYSVDGGASDGFRDAVVTRGQPGADDEPPTDFGLAVGAIVFDPDVTWNFSLDASDLDSGENDFLSVATHELCHVFGIGTAASWTALVDDDEFTGPKSVASYGGPVPTDGDDAHFAEGTQSGGREVLMDPSITVGERKTLTPLDFAALDDIGWTFDPFATILAVDADATEPDDNGTFRIALPAPATSPVTVNVQVRGAAGRGRDYALFVGATPVTGNTVTIPAGQASVDVTVDVIDDLLTESDEAVTVELREGTGYAIQGDGSDVDTVLIVDNDTFLTVSTRDGNISESNNNGRLRISRSGSVADDLTFNFRVGGDARRGSDYTLKYIVEDDDDDEPNPEVRFNGRTVTIPAGRQFVDVVIFVEDNEIPERPEDLAFRIVGGTGTAYRFGVSDSFARVTILDDDRPIEAVNAPTRGGGTSDLGASDPQLSADGRFATFLSNGTNLVDAPLTTYFQIFRRDLVRGTTRLVSVADGGNAEADADAVTSRVSDDGRYVAFETTARNVVSSRVDVNGVSDVYVRDMQTNQTLLVSRNSTNALGGELVSISRDGNRVLFTSTAAAGNLVRGVTDENGTSDLFVWDRRTGRTQLVSANGSGTATGNRTSKGTSLVGRASFSADGNLVVFPSRASDLVRTTTDGNTFQYDLFVRDLAAGRTEYVSRAATGNRGADGASGDGEISDDGRYVLFRTLAGNVTALPDGNRAHDLYVRDRQTSTTRLVSLDRSNLGAADGPASVGDMSADGRFVTYSTTATNASDLDATEIADVYLVDMTTMARTLVSLNVDGTAGGDAGSVGPIISDDGAVVVYASNASTLPGDIDKTTRDFAALYSYEVAARRNTVVSADRGRNAASGDSGLPVLSADGTRLAFLSDVGALLEGDANGEADLFVLPTPGAEDVGLAADGRLTVRGSRLNDTIAIQRVSGTIIVTRDDDRYEFPTGELTAIDVLTGDGEDVVTIGSSVTLPTYVSAGRGNDRVTAGGGRDVVQGGPGQDTINGGEGDDRLDGGKGSDSVAGAGGVDRLLGGDGNDTLDGGGGVDRLFDGIGTDRLIGGTGDDRFYAARDDAADLIFGNDGDDSLFREGGIAGSAEEIVSSVENA